jgi:hypothetical protein
MMHHLIDSEDSKSKWLPSPKVDSDKVSLSFIAVGYGVVLVAVFPASAVQLAKAGVDGFLHLALAALMLAVSWVGFYTNRQKYPVWRAQFFNFPLFEYLISFAVLFAYWELGLTVGQTAPFGPSPRPEAIFTLLVFTAYLVWDFLEITVQESRKYVKVVLSSEDHDLIEKLPPQCCHVFWNWPFRGNVFKWKLWPNRGDRFAKDLRAARIVTLIFTVGYLIALGLVISHRHFGPNAAAIVDGIYIISLFLYRYLQWGLGRWLYRVIRNPSAT